LAPAPLSGVASAPTGLLQRKCACGQHTGGGECEECRKKKEKKPAGMLQRKLAVGPPGDSFEQEADRVAEAVTGGRSTSPSRISAARPSLRRSAETDGPEEAPAVVGKALRSPGQPLGAGVRAFLEPRIGHDFSRVRVHTDELAARSSRSVEALAFTVGSDVVFGAGQYAPETQAGRGLLAHELTHVVQQAQAPAALVQRKGVWGAISGFFNSFIHIAFDYSDKAILEYLELLEKGEIEGDPDSDDKARQIVRKKQHLTLSVQVRTLLVSEMLDGPTLGGDESAIIEIVRSATPADRKAIIDKIGRGRIWKDFSGENRRTIEALTLTAADLQDSGVMTRLRGLSESELVDYQKNVVDPEVAKAIDKLLREKRHELSSYPEQERRKISLGGTFTASSAEAFGADLEAAKAQQSRPSAVQQTMPGTGTTMSRVEVVDVPEIAIPAGIAFEFETKIDKENRPGLERIGKHMLSESNLPQNTTRNLAIKELGKIYRFTRFDHRNATGSTELVLIEEIGPIPATVEVTEAGWNVDHPRPDSIPAGSFKVRTFDFKRDQDWRGDEWDLVVAALASFPDSVLKEVAGVNFKRRPCQDKFIQNGVCTPRETRTGEVEAGERKGGDVNDESITLFDEAFAASPSKYGTSTILVSVLAHEVGHQVDLHPLDVALDTYNKGTDQARAELDKALAEPEPPVKAKKKPKKDEKSKADLAIEKYDIDKAALKGALDQSRSLSGVGWQDDGTTRTLTDAPAGVDGDFMKAAALDGLVMTGEKVALGSITEYGKKSIVEQFAELFSVYLTDPKLLEMIRPHVYAYFAARFPR
jgi:hypothetical protein